jgi:monoamine oxidase
VCVLPPGKFPYWLNYQPFTPKKSIPVLLGVCTGHYAATMADRKDAQIIDDAMSVLKAIYGPHTPPPVKYVISRWDDEEFSRGSYAFAPVGATDADFDATGGHERQVLFFAGEHTQRKLRGTV